MSSANATAHTRSTPASGEVETPDAGTPSEPRAEQAAADADHSAADPAHKQAGAPAVGSDDTSEDKSAGGDGGSVQTAGTASADEVLAEEFGISGYDAARLAGLRLTKLTLNGFKSFADRTEFAFDQAITGVVGPNGCGKSNLVDAIKWVLGERSSKSLRGKEMIDVIFAGSAGRRPMGMAAVTLTFDNPERQDAQAQAAQAATGGTDPREEAQPDGADVAQAPGESEHADDATPSALVADRRRIRRPLPVDSDEVAVERRLYRDGRSQYLINGRIARLRDIRELFLDTGIGADAYSIIEQGKVDAMLLASAQERRTIFEEAAGVAKYKQRRIESQRKLERAEQNLAVTREQLDSTERRLRIVRGQAAKARRFRELDSEYTALRTVLAFEQYHSLRDQLDGLTSRLQHLQTERDETLAAVASLEHDKQEIEADRASAHREHRRLSDELQSARHAAAQATQRREMAENAVADARRRVEQDSRRVQDAGDRIGRLTTDLEDQRSCVAEFAEGVAQAEATLSRENERRAGLLESLGGTRRELGEREREAQQIERERTQLLARVQADERRIESFAEQIERLDERLASNARDAEASAASLRERGEKVGRLEREAAACSERAEALAAKVEELGSSRRDLADRLAGLEADRVRLESRRQTLQEMVASREGLGDAVKAVLESKEKGEGFAGVVAPLAELVSADAQHAAAVEAALGRDLQALAVRTLGDLPGGDELRALSGRVTFMPLAALSPAPEPVDQALLASLSARVSAVRPMVHGSGDAGVDDLLSGLLDRLLGRTLLVATIDAALMLASGPLPGCRFVTPDGAVLEPDGRVLAGPTTGETGGVIQRRAELRELEAELSRLTREVESLREELNGVDAGLAGLNTERTEAERGRVEAERSLVGERAAVERAQAELGRLERDRGSIASEAESVRERIASIESDRDELRERAERLGRLHAEHTEEAEKIRAEVQRSERALEAATEQMTAARVETGKLNEQLSGARKELTRLEIERDQAERHKAEHERHLEETRLKVEQHRETIERATEDAQQAAAAAERLGGEVEAASASAADADERAAVLQADLDSARQRARVVERDWSSLEMSRRELEIKRETLEERTAEEVVVLGRGLDLARDYWEFKALIREDCPRGALERVDLPDTQARVNVLRSEIKKLGNVNLDSIAEEDTLAEKNEDLARQVEDIDSARRQLIELIGKLNEASKQRFGEVFERIRENFGGHDGMFRKLFGGGRAEVRLMGLVKEIDGQKVVTDEIDLLESGIEVIAKPPGKEPRSISQLSGGEKTLTAVALLMSIFRSKPSCFCVLDEVDAALDEANVRRFCQTIREFTDHSRFIVITHNKRTMQLADHLFGVTQQERGVSKRVSVRFDQVAADGTIAKEAVAAATDNGAQTRAAAESDAAPAEIEAKPVRRPSAALLG